MEFLILGSLGSLKEWSVEKAVDFILFSSPPAAAPRCAANAADLRKKRPKVPRLP
jgi:hypothetical protein